MIPSTRRIFLEHMLAAAVIPFSALSPSCSHAPDSSGKAYLQRILDICRTIKRNEATTIRDAANLFAETIIARNRCFFFSGYPAYPGYLNEDTPGLPRVFINLRSKSMVETIRAGDALLVTDTGEFPEIARKHGARIVGITSPRFIDEYKQSLHSSFTEKRHMGDTAEMLLHSHLPFPDGVVKCPEYPFPILPGSGIVRLLLVTALAGETYRRSGGIGLTGNLPPEDALGFISTVIDRAGKITDRIDGIRKAGSMAAEKIMQRGSLCIYDSREALKNEISEVYGGPLFARYITRQEIMDGRLKSRDVLLFGSLRSNAQGDLDLVRTARSFTDAVISLCPHDETGGYRLFKESAFGLDNLSIEKDGVRSFDEGQKTLLHTGGIMNCILMWMLIGETIDSLASRGKPPAYLMGSYVTGSEEYNAKARTLAEKRGF